jgi:Histidine kinase-, DNA gyrase B-, and HSP90-like ATPase
VITRLRALFGKKDPANEPVDLNEATHEVIALLQSELQRSRVILRAELGGAIPRITGDRVQLQQVILNLLRNALDAMSSIQDHPRQLVIRTEREADDRVRLSVQDAGVASNLKTKADSSTRSTPPRAAAWGSVCQSAAQSSRVITAVCGPHRMTVREPRFHFPFRGNPRVRNTPTILELFGRLG